MCESVEILGIEFSKLTLSETIQRIDEQITMPKGEAFHIITANPEIAMQINRDPEFKRISRHAGLITPDGVGILLAAKLKGANIKERVTGVEILPELLKLGEKKGYSIYFLGAKENVNNRMIENITLDHPDLIIAGRRNGYFSENDENEIVDDINKSSTDIMIMALGSPRSHKWFDRNRDILNVKIVLGVGGGFDILSGEVKRAPKIVQSLGIEWLYRRIQDPSRRERQKDLFVFVKELFKEVLTPRRA